LIFIVATDNPAWSKRKIIHPNWKIHFTSDFPTPAGIDPIMFDFTVLSHCHHAVVDYGTFSFWTGYLTGGNVWLPKYYKNTNKMIDIVPEIMDSGLHQSRYHFVD
jgi:hypothetical protein